MSATPPLIDCACAPRKRCRGTCGRDLPDHAFPLGSDVCWWCVSRGFDVIELDPDRELPMSVFRIGARYRQHRNTTVYVVVEISDRWIQGVPEAELRRALDWSVLE